MSDKNTLGFNQSRVLVPFTKSVVVHSSHNLARGTAWNDFFSTAYTNVSAFNMHSKRTEQKQQWNISNMIIFNLLGKNYIVSLNFRPMFFSPQTFNSFFFYSFSTALVFRVWRKMN